MNPNGKSVSGNRDLVLWIVSTFHRCISRMVMKASTRQPQYKCLKQLPFTCV